MFHDRVSSFFLLLLFASVKRAEGLCGGQLIVVGAVFVMWMFGRANRRCAPNRAMVPCATIASLDGWIEWHEVRLVRCPPSSIERRECDRVAFLSPWRLVHGIIYVVLCTIDREYSDSTREVTQ